MPAFCYSPVWLSLLCSCGVSTADKRIIRGQNIRIEKNTPAVLKFDCFSAINRVSFAWLL